ncbi:hypothetical protein DY138_00490 [Apilactobacillus timberlakei]|uniref:hypothetical protein n=1 Tax=Apilactobacillus timberlakei TaxID=2008380 RepID=UPI00112EA430|nr:hypothetical protein [Apilactobacillus timberlakei]TPR19947.1 hypothetical protein DY138_00490 [Apilactobacillus timberlakei]TPR21665.1 hypothetical protein DY061_00405 [Apilactobacillus timberlakei]TPR22911.1 hypothetical protein DY083_02225 [Apilactobacillus timberlakei]
MAIFTFIVSFGSLIFSIYVFFNNKSDKNSRKKYDILSPIYIKSLTDDIPDKFSKLNFKISSGNGVDEFVESIRDLNKKIKVIQIIDKNIYSNWNKQILNIEDFVIDKANNLAIDDNHQNHIMSELSKKLNILYKTILSEDFSNIFKK